MKTAKIKIFLTAIAALCAANIAFAQQEITLAGSDLIKPYITDYITAQAANSNIRLDINMGGSYAVFDDLKDGKADIAIIALPKGQKIPDGLTYYPFAYQVAIVIVNTINPLEELSTRQLFNIYSKNARIRAETWAQLSVNNIGLRNITPITTSFSDNVVVELFKYNALGGTNLGSWVNIVNSKQDVFNMIKANNSAIGVVGKLTDTNLIKAVAISASSDESARNFAFRPDRDNIFNGDYPLTMPFYVVFKKQNAAKIRALGHILLSDELAKQLDATDFLSAPQNSRKKSILELDMSN